MWIAALMIFAFVLGAMTHLAVVLVLVLMAVLAVVSWRDEDYSEEE